MSGRTGLHPYLHDGMLEELRRSFGWMDGPTPPVRRRKMPEPAAMTWAEIGFFIGTTGTQAENVGIRAMRKCRIWLECRGYRGEDLP